MSNFKFWIVRFIFVLLTCDLIAWVVSSYTEISRLDAFLFLAFGLPILSFIEKLIRAPSYLFSAYLMRKDLMARCKNQLLKLNIKTAEDWIDFQSFYDDDQAIGKYAEKDSKAFAVGARYNLQGIREGGDFIGFLVNGLAISRAMEQMFWEARDKEQLEFVKSEGYESWAEYMVENVVGEDVRESYKEDAKKEKQKRENKKVLK